MSDRPRHALGRILPPFAVVAAVLSLAACAAPNQAKAPSTTQVQPAAYTPPPEQTLPPAGPDAAHPSLADLARGPQRFEGLAGKEVLAALGDPNFRRRESPAEIWQYYGPGCILDLFLYDDTPATSGGVAPDGKVAHAELRGRPGEPIEAACLSRLIGQRHGSQRAG